MRRRLWTWWGLIALAGCVTPRPLPPLPAPTVEKVRLFGKELAPTEEAVRAEVSNLISPGMPLEQATALLRAHGLEPRAYPAIPAEVMRAFTAPPWHILPGVFQGFAYPAILGEWGRRFAVVRVLVAPDAAGAVKDVHVSVGGPCADPRAVFFELRPALPEPVGLPVAEAQARMQAAGFQCSAAADGARGRPHLFCVAVAEQAPRRLLAIRLYHDEAGVVRDTEIVREPLPEIRLFGKALPADEWLLRAELLQFVPLGMPMDRAAAALKERGLVAAFGPFNYPGFELQVPMRNCRAVHPGTTWARGQALYVASAEDVHDWGRAFRKVLVVLTPDAAHNVKEVRTVLSLPVAEPAHAIFAARPELRDPVGLPLDVVRIRMEAAEFRCSAHDGEADSAGRPYLYCWRRVENPVGGYVLRVRLYPDEAGVVRDAEILREARWFEAERCMLPAADDSPEWFALRAALFPVRVSCRYTLIMIALALSNPGGGMGHVCVGHHGR